MSQPLAANGKRAEPSWRKGSSSSPPPLPLSPSSLPSSRSLHRPPLPSQLWEAAAAQGQPAQPRASSPRLFALSRWEAEVLQPLRDAAASSEACSSPAGLSTMCRKLEAALFIAAVRSNHQEGVGSRGKTSDQDRARRRSLSTSASSPSFPRRGPPLPSAAVPSRQTKVAFASGAGWLHRQAINQWHVSLYL